MSEIVAPAAPAPAAAPIPPVPAEGEPKPAQNTGEQAPPTAPEGEKPDTGQDPEKQSSRRFERRLDKAYRKAAEAQARAEFFEKQLAEFKTKAAPTDDPGAPKLEGFKDIEEYAEAKAKYESEKAVKQHTTKQQTEARNKAQAQLVEAWDARADKAGDKYEDFDEVVGQLRPTSPWSMAVMEAENGDDIAYYLGKNLKEAQRISALSPTAQIREIGKLEHKLSAEPPKPKTPSRAPAPITPLSGASSVATEAPSDQDDMRTWIRKRNKQLGRK